MNNRIKDEFTRKDNKKTVNIIGNDILEVDEDGDKKTNEVLNQKEMISNDLHEDNTNERKDSNCNNNEKKLDMVDPSLIIKDGFNETNYNEFLVNKTNMSVIRDAFGDISCIEKNNI